MNIRRFEIGKNILIGIIMVTAGAIALVWNGVYADGFFTLAGALMTYIFMSNGETIEKRSR